MIIAQAGLLFVLMTVLTGVLYPLAVCGLGQLLWPHKSMGSLVRHENRVLGSALIGQNFSSPYYFWPRPSSSDYSALPGLASNLGPTSLKLKNLIDLRRQRLANEHNVALEGVPEILLTSSGSGLDPHISLEAAEFQIERISKARGFDTKDQERLKGLVAQALEQPQFGFLGQARVNVLLLNLTLDQTFLVK